MYNTICVIIRVTVTVLFVLRYATVHMLVHLHEPEGLAEPYSVQ